jgi:hypothetical protein
VRPGRSPLKHALVAGLAGLLAGCAGPLVSGSATETCWPVFPYRDGWLGGDAAYSIPLSRSETLWLFGDTFVGTPGQEDRQGAAFVHNSIAVSRCSAGGRWEIDYAWGRSPDGTPRAFLERSEPEAWWWLFDGFLHAGRLYLGLLEVAHAPPSGPLAMPFAFTGVQLARISNPRDEPEDWRMEVVALSSGSGALPAGAMVVHDAHVYFFTFLERGNGHYPRTLARLPLRALDGKERDVSTALEYLARDGAWKPGLDPDDARVLMDDAATEMSVRFHDGLGRWLALYSYPDVGDAFPETPPSDAVWIRTAEHLEGPWSERRLLFRVPELDPAYAGGHDPNTGCYAAKEHPQFSSGRRVTFTYVCNLFTGRGQDPMQILDRLLVDMGLYRPIPVAVELPPGLEALR